MATLALIRYVTPLIDCGVCDAAEAARRMILYDTTQSLALYETYKFKSSVAQEKLAGISRIYSSPLPRDGAKFLPSPTSQSRLQPPQKRLRFLYFLRSNFARKP